MCGIVGALAFGKMNKKDEDVRQKIMRYFTEELLVETETRGKDATGATILFEGGNYVGIKRGDKASTFLSKFGKNKDTYGGFLEIWRKYDKPVKIYLGHCRAGTGGEKEENANNHPIRIGNLVGVHNGIVRNDDKIIENLGCKRDGKVDSEAIFRLFEHYTSSGKEPFTISMVQEVVNRLDGQFAVALFNADNPYQVPVFRDSRPVEFFLIKDYGLLFIVSERDFWNVAHFRYERAVYDHGLNLPSFIDTPIEKEDLADDSCLIFDLTKKVNKNTKIKDLGEWSKMDRNSKTWKSTTVMTTYHNTTYPYTAKNTDVNMSKEDEEKKTRVFDNINKRYVSKVGDKILKADEEAVIPVDKSNAAADNTPPPDKPSNIKSTDEGAEEEGAPSLGINDRTSYTTEEKKEKEEVKEEKEDKTQPLIEKHKETTKENGENGDGKIIEVDMTQDSKELVEAAAISFLNLPTIDKGYADMGEVLDKLDIQSSKAATEIGMVALLNRAFRYAWKKGFIKACESTYTDHTESLKSNTKASKREKYITGLKSLVILLAMHFDQTIIKNLVNTKSPKYTNLDTMAKKYFAHNKNNDKVDITDLITLFGRGEKSKIKTATKLIESAINKANKKSKAANKKSEGV